ncbi:MAG TPA: SGNH/GDSL hydrolase family protein, partial [Thermoanaerobaculia bacterium]|nr:SGNH/GDSL hydrolase family protein [Thermoanaerobaculia bacterium]
MPTSRQASPSPLLLRALAVLTSGSLALALFCAWGWYRARQERTSIDALSPEDRQALAEEMLVASPGAFIPALFEPAVGYTLKPGQRITEWDSEVAANEIGYRMGRLGRGGREGFRVVFLGDSWTFGMGISEEESFPRQFEALANRLGAANGRVVAFNLGLPGYNVGNEVAALEFFYDRLRPDAVVLCPTPNDAESTANVLPNGSLTRSGVERDRYGDPSLVFPLRGADSFRLRSRWRQTFDEVRRLEERLEKRGVPLLVDFTATWDEPLAHELMRGSRLKAPYLVTPPALTEGRFRNPPPWRHGTAEANRLYAHMVYRGLADLLGWPPPPPVEEKRAEVPLYRRPPAEGPELRELREQESRRIPERYEPGPAAQVQCVGAMNCATG